MRRAREFACVPAFCWLLWEHAGAAQKGHYRVRHFAGVVTFPVMKRALVNSHVSVMSPCLVLLGAELMARCACECFEFVRVYILCVQRAFSCGDAPSITAGTHKQERVWARVRAQRGVDISFSGR